MVNNLLKSGLNIGSPLFELALGQKIIEEEENKSKYL